MEDKEQQWFALVDHLQVQVALDVMLKFCTQTVESSCSSSVHTDRPLNACYVQLLASVGCLNVVSSVRATQP